MTEGWARCFHNLTVQADLHWGRPHDEDISEKFRRHLRSVMQCIRRRHDYVITFPDPPCWGGGRAAVCVAGMGRGWLAVRAWIKWRSGRTCLIWCSRRHGLSRGQPHAHIMIRIYRLRRIVDKKIWNLFSRRAKESENDCARTQKGWRVLRMVGYSNGVKWYWYEV